MKSRLPIVRSAGPAPPVTTRVAVRPTIRLAIELVVPVGNDPGPLAQVLRAVASRRVTLLASCTAFEVERFAILLVTESPLAAKTALAQAGLSCSAQSVVLVRAPDRAGTAAALSRQLRAAGIAIWHEYAAVLHPPELCAVFSTGDDRRALRVLAAIDLTESACQRRWTQ